MRTTSLFLTLATLTTVSSTFGWRIQGWDFDVLLEKSDLVVIAVPLSVRDTDERIDLPGRIQYGDTEQDGIPARGVETRFRVVATLKGLKSVTEFTLHHYHLLPVLADKPTGTDSPTSVLGGGPMLVEFDPESRPSQPYLLFLVRESDGRYAPTSGQTDPGAYSIHPLQGIVANDSAHSGEPRR